MKKERNKAQKENTSSGVRRRAQRQGHFKPLKQTTVGGDEAFGTSIPCELPVTNWSQRETQPKLSHSRPDL